jgi:hypothetical protein
MNGNGITAAAAIEKYIALRDKCEAMMAEANAAMKPYDNAMKTLATWLGAEMARTGANSIKTDRGTAYTATVTSTKIVDREKFIAFIELGHWELANLSASVPETKAFMEQNHGALPDGIETSAVIHVRVRRP